MALFDEDYLVSDSVAAPPASPLVVPQEPGIGLQPPAADAAAPVPDMNRAERRTDSRRAYIDQMGTGQKILAAIGEFGAGVTGRQSPIDARMRAQREEKLASLQEFKVHTDALEDGVKMAGKLQGDARDQFIENYAQQLESVRPGLGETYRTLSKQPGNGSLISKYKDKSPTLARALEIGGPEAVMKLLSSPDAIKTINSEIDSGVLPTIVKKGQMFKMGWQQIVPPEMSERFNKDGQITASELQEANEWIKSNKPDMKALVISDEEQQIIGRNQDAFYGALGIVGPKDEQKVLAERMKGERAQSDIGKLGADLKAGRITQAQHDARVAKLNRQGEGGDSRMTPATISVNGKNVAALVDKSGNYFDANTRKPIQGGIGPQITEADERRNRELTGRAEAVTSLEKDVNKLEEIVKKHPRSAAGLFSPVARGIEYVAGSVNPEGKGSTPGSQAVQLRDSILQRSGRLTRMTNADRERLENALQIGTGGNPRNLGLAIQLLRDNIAKEKAEVGSGRARPKAGGKNPAEMSDDELLKALSGG